MERLRLILGSFLLLTAVGTTAQGFMLEQSTRQLCERRLEINQAVMPEFSYLFDKENCK